MEPWKTYEVLKKLQIKEVENKDNVRVIQRCLDYLKGKRQAPTFAMWNLMRELYENYKEEFERME